MQDKTPQHIKIDEKNHVENPLLDQLESLGWNILRLENTQYPDDGYRESFNEVILLPELKASLKKINTFLEDDQIDEVARRIDNCPHHSLIENNRHILDLLLGNTSVSENRKTGEKNPTVKYIDFENIENNSFVAISQFKVRIPGTENHIIPDIVLFLNGLPVSVIECKSPKIKEPIAEAIEQLLRYSEQREAGREGNQKLFYYNQVIIVTCRNTAKFGTISTHIEKLFYRWTDPYPFNVNDISTGGALPNDQQRLVQGMFSKKNLLNLIQIFTIFGTNSKGKTIKIVGRYQQYRAVYLTIKKLLEGKNKIERSGIIWHTQGSGKSLTMMFLVRAMSHYEKLKKYKIVFVTDRTQLETQLTETSQGIGFSVKSAEWIKPKQDKPGRSLFELLSNNKSDLVMTMIHKFQEVDLNEMFPELNTSSEILVMIDEAHRTEYGSLARNFDRAIPNATEIAFTGTPIDKTEHRFRDYIDKYTMRQSIEDGVTLKIIYEGRTHSADVTDKKGMDEKFADIFSEYKISERLLILGFGSRNAYLNAEPVIKAKAKNMIKHYIKDVFPNYFKAQIVANSREAAVRYKKAVDAELQEEIKALEQNNPDKIDLEVLKKLRTAVIVSGMHNDLPHMREHTNSVQHKKDIASFKLSFKSKVDDTTGDIGILIVNNMLLTGFDAPIEQVMYLDQVIKDHNLLQAIARVNRVDNDIKKEGFVVDYVGVGNDLKKALDAYDEREQKEIIGCIGDIQSEINAFIAAYNEIMELLKKNNMTDLSDYDAFYDLFYDEDIRFAFMLAYKKLSSCLNTVMHRKEILQYWNDYLKLSESYTLAAKHFQDKRMSMKGIPEKLLKITDEYLVSKGIDIKVEPIAITDKEFYENSQKHKRAKSKATQIEHAIRNFIEVHYNEDPELFASFYDAIKEILTGFKNNWDTIYKKLEELRERIVKTDKEPTYGLHKKKHMPFFRIFKNEFFKDNDLTDDNISVLVNLTQHVVNALKVELVKINFWKTPGAPQRLRGDLTALLISPEFSGIPDVFDKRSQIVSRIMETANANNDIILYANGN